MIDVEYIDHMGDDLAVVNAARVSFEAESDWEIETDQIPPNVFEYTQNLSNRDAKLIYFLARHKHKSPFNHCFVRFRCHAPIFVARQLQKHEYLPWNEVSRRYVDSDPEFYMPDEADWRRQPENVKQGSGAPLCPKATPDICAGYRELIRVAENLYYNSIERGLCREQARMFLPQSMMTTWIWSGSLYAFAKMCALRTDSHAQKEASYVAQPILETLYELFPVSTEALMKHGVT